MRKLRDKKITLFRRVCGEQGIKVTHQRLQIFLEVVNANDHPSVEDVFERVRLRMPTVSLDTIYRTLSTFEKHGLITRVSFCEDKMRFDPNTHPHHHLVCRQCRGLQDFHWPEIDLVGLPHETAEWGQVEGIHVQVQGLCSKCLSADDSSSRQYNQRTRKKCEKPEAN